MIKAAQTKYLEDLEPILNPLGFRRSHHQEWTYRLDAANELWVHINFGLAIVNPSIGVSYLDLINLLPTASGAVTGTVIMLSSLSKPPRLYTIEEGSAPVANDLCDKGMQMLSLLRDRDYVIERLKESRVSAWPVRSYSDRIRLLPLLLANNGRSNEAIHLVESFRSESLGRDQMLPRFEDFAKIFSERFAT